MSWWEQKGFFDTMDELIDNAVDPLGMRDFYKGSPLDPFDPMIMSLWSEKKENSNESPNSTKNDDNPFIF